ncbi:hypothetical protein BC835DRAFT_1355108 [Cytidiella melzeri]|nr:hypothetical protein BC835DRAFT_1355108 [Cytidiella melzeri]
MRRPYLTALRLHSFDHPYPPLAMDDIRFVLEAPQNARTQKKRPRLVTSCDNCRLKKIKCIQSSPSAVCGACSAAHQPCRFRDRERYFAERSRLVSTSSKTASVETHTTNTTTVSDLPPTHHSHPNGPVARTSPKRISTHHPYHNSPAQSLRLSTQPTESPPPLPPTSSPLFDPRYPSRPRSQLMLPYINAFFDNMSLWFPFLAFDETIKRFLMQDLSVLQANCIAALAVRYVDIPEVNERGAVRAADDYALLAKSLAGPAIAEGPHMDTLHSLILLAWVEYNQHRQVEFSHYGQLAIHMAMTLGLGDENAIQMSGHTEYERRLLKSTRWSVIVLESTLQSCMCAALPA